MSNVVVKNSDGTTQTYSGVTKARLKKTDDSYAYFTEVSGSLSITSNGTYDVSEKASAVVNVSGGQATIASLIDRTIASVDLTGVTNIGGYAFASCQNLSSISIPSTVEGIGAGAFMGTEIQHMTIPDTATWIEPQQLFNRCVNLQDVTFPEIIDDPLLSNWLLYRTFYLCVALRSVVFPNFARIELQDTFMANNSLQSLTFRSTTPPFPNQADINNGVSRSINNIPQSCAIYVPASAVSDYQNDQYWSIKASQIQAIPT